MGFLKPWDEDKQGADASRGFHREDVGKTVAKVASFGGHITISKRNKGLYFGSGKHMSKERLFNCHGPLHPGTTWGDKGEILEEALHSDTRQDLTRELVSRGLTQKAAQELISKGLKEGYLMEINDPDLGGKVIISTGKGGENYE